MQAMLNKLVEITVTLISDVQIAMTGLPLILVAIFDEDGISELLD